MRRFAIDDVTPAAARLPAHRLADRYTKALAFGGNVALPVIDHGATHPLLAAVGIAFAQHRPLVLSPDAVWLTIAQGVAQHVRLHAEELRPRLVGHVGRKRLAVTTTVVPHDAATWSAAIDALRAELTGDIGDGRARVFTCDFSTSTDVDRLASEIVLLDAYAPYFSYWLVAICGIPELTLLGTVEDWRRIRERIDVVAELDLGVWHRSLAPIADHFVRAAGGDIDLAFWRRIYNPIDAYGGDVITGWIARLYPYLEHAGAVARPNPLLDLPLDEPKHLTTATGRWYSGPGVRSDDVPATVSRVTVHVVDERARTHTTVALVGGVTAVTQDDAGRLRPIAGWHVEPAVPQIRDVADRLLAEHAATPATNNRERGPQLSGPAEVMELFGHIDSATLFSGDRTWRIRPPREQHHLSIERGGRLSLGRLADIPAGMSLCWAAEQSTSKTRWFVCRVQDPPPTDGDAIGVMPGSAEILDDASEIRLLGGSLAAILDAALDAGGDIAQLEVGRFDELLRV